MGRGAKTGLIFFLVAVAACAVYWSLNHSSNGERPSLERETDFARMSLGCVLIAPFEEVLVDEVKADLRPRIFLVNKRTKKVVRSWSTEFSPTTARIDKKGKLWVLSKMFWERVPPIQIDALDTNSKKLETVFLDSMGMDFDLTPGGVVFIQIDVRNNPRSGSQQPYRYHRLAEFDINTKKIVWEFDPVKEYPNLFVDINDQQRRSRDMTHINSVRYIEKNPITQTPAILVIVRNISKVFLIDYQTRKVLWMSGDQFHFPHDAHFLNNGNLLLFNNRVSPVYSSVEQWDIIGNKKVWEYKSITEIELHSGVFGSAQRMTNGNTLITEGVRGHVLEVTPDGQLVWEYFQTLEMLDKRRSWPLVPLFRAEHYSPEFIEGLGWGDQCS